MYHGSRVWYLIKCFIRELCSQWLRVGKFVWSWWADWDRDGLGHWDELLPAVTSSQMRHPEHARVKGHPSRNDLQTVKIPSLDFRLSSANKSALDSSSVWCWSSFLRGLMRLITADSLHSCPGGVSSSLGRCRSILDLYLSPLTAEWASGTSIRLG